MKIQSHDLFRQNNQKGNIWNRNMDIKKENEDIRRFSKKLFKGNFKNKGRD